MSKVSETNTSTVNHCLNSSVKKIEKKELRNALIDSQDQFFKQLATACVAEDSHSYNTDTSFINNVSFNTNNGRMKINIGDESKGNIIF